MYSDMFEKLTPGVTVADVHLDSSVPPPVVGVSSASDAGTIDNDCNSGEAPPAQSLYQPNYVVLIDHRHRDIVVCIRGSINVADVLTDLVCESVKVEGLFNSNGLISHSPPSFDQYKPLVGESLGSIADPTVYAHSGMFYAALNLDRLLRSDVAALLSKPEHAGYGVLVSGHSLGAGVAALLTLLWLPVFPTTAVHCVAYSPPCILSVGAAKHPRVVSAITSVVISDDVVARLSLGSCLDLRDSLLRLHESESGSGGSSTSTANTCDNITDGNVQTMKDMRENVPKYHKLYPPGQIIHIVDRSIWDMHVANGGSNANTMPATNSNSSSGSSSGTKPPTPPSMHYHDCCTGEYKSLPVITMSSKHVAYYADQLTFQEMVLSSTMLSDHMPHYCLKLCKDVFKQKK